MPEAFTPRPPLLLGVACSSRGPVLVAEQKPGPGDQPAPVGLTAHRDPHASPTPVPVLHEQTLGVPSAGLPACCPAPSVTCPVCSCRPGEATELLIVQLLHLYPQCPSQGQVNKKGQWDGLLPHPHTQQAPSCFLLDGAPGVTEIRAQPGTCPGLPAPSPHPETSRGSSLCFPPPDMENDQGPTAELQKGLSSEEK